MHAFGLDLIGFHHFHFQQCTPYAIFISTWHYSSYNFFIVVFFFFFEIFSPFNLNNNHLIKQDTILLMRRNETIVRIYKILNETNVYTPSQTHQCPTWSPLRPSRRLHPHGPTPPTTHVPLGLSWHPMTHFWLLPHGQDFIYITKRPIFFSILAYSNSFTKCSIEKGQYNRWQRERKKNKK